MWIERRIGHTIKYISVILVIFMSTNLSWAIVTGGFSRSNPDIDVVFSKILFRLARVQERISEYRFDGDIESAYDLVRYIESQMYEERIYISRNIQLRNREWSIEETNES
jgi:hypothetical protein